MLRGIPLWSESLGLSGRADIVEIADGAVRPVEYKSGVRHGATADLQLCAQALCLEEMLGVDIQEGAAWFGGPKGRVRFEFTATLRREVKETVQQIRNPFVHGALRASS